jgi:glycerol-3-phosphate dehydrogenase
MSAFEAATARAGSVGEVGQAEPPPLRIERVPERAAERSYDLIVIGGGIHGVALCLEATLGGYRTLLLERADFGGATSWSSLRIIHGGLRYLQSLDLPRFFQSVAERRWFLRHFPDLVRPLPCLMPLYGRGLRKPAVLRLALAANDLLSLGRNGGVAEEARLPGGRILDASETTALFPNVDRQGLRGGALWHDAVMLSPERVLIEMLRWAVAGGAFALNYVEAERLVVENGEVRGVEACDRLSGERLVFRSPRAFNAGGAGCTSFAKGADPQTPDLFPPALAFNLLLDRPAIAEVAVAIEPRRPGGRMYFVLPWRGRMLAGTFHAPSAKGATEARPTEEQVAAFLDDLNATVPGLELRDGDVVQIYAGLLPARREGDAEPAPRERIHDHGQSAGPKGFYTVVGIKFTTARAVAAATLKKIAADGRGAPRGNPSCLRPAPALGFRRSAAPEGAHPPGLELTRESLQALVDQEAVVEPDDLLLRRMDSTASLSDRARAEEISRGLFGRSGPDSGEGRAIGNGPDHG